jgi:meromycolic acid enoyl-[acyl-carrier protein] reductase
VRDTASLRRGGNGGEEPPTARVSADADMLKHAKLLISGVMTHRSIAFAVAARAQLAGADIVLTSPGRARRMTERAAKMLPVTPNVLELDINNDDNLSAVVAELDRRWGRLDGALHAIAYAPRDALGGRFLQTPAESAIAAFRTSAYSLKVFGCALAPLLENGGSIVGLDFDGQVAWPAYDWMGVSKAALEAVSRYLARDLGARNIRVNLISAGPIETVSADGIPGFEALAGEWYRRAPLGWDVADPDPIACAACFLLSAWSRGITAEIVHVDGGFHAMGGGPLPQA